VCWLTHCEFSSQLLAINWFAWPRAGGYQIVERKRLVNGHTFVADRGFGSAGLMYPLPKKSITGGKSMTSMTRRKFATIAAAGAASLGFGTPIRYAKAAEFTYKYANNLPASHPMNLRATQAAERIKTQTNGRLEIQIFPNNQLGGDTDMLAQVRAGALELFMNSGINVLSTLIPSASVYGLGFIFPDYDAVWKAMDGELGAYVGSQISKAGLVPMEKMWDNGFRNVTTSTKPVVTPDDLKNLKIRVPVGPLWTSMFKAFGSSPTSINFNEIYSALQTKVVDAQETPLALIYTANLFEVQKYCSLTNHMWDGYFCVANRRAWEALPADFREIVAKNLNQAALEERDDLAKLNVSLQTQLAQKGLQFNQPNTALFREALREAGFYKEWREKYGEELWSLLEKSVGKLS
jgi:TRAP-type transport system periplasmic protein